MGGWSSEAFAAFHERHVTVVRRVVRSIVRNEADAEDVVQDVFLQAWRHIGRYDVSRGSIDAWLTVMARSRAIDRKRADSRERETDVGASASALPDAFVSLVRGNERSALHRAFARLPSEQQHLLSLVYLDGLSHSRIASLLGTPLGTVKTRIRAAVAQLRGLLCDDRTAGGAPAGDAASVPFTVPICGDRAPVAFSVMTIDPQAEAALRGLDVLVVDDDGETLSLIVAVLSRFGVRATARASARDALTALRESWPGVMLADLDMPGDDGYALLGQARAMGHERGNRLPVAAFTGRCSEEERARTRIAGFDAYLTKPIHPLAVLSAVARLGGRAVA